MTERFKFRDANGLMASIGRHGRAPRCGSYPLMNLAEDYGVDYGDVLIWADYLRRDRCGLRNSRGLMLALHLAMGRIIATIGWDRQNQLLDAMLAHANLRWGRRG